jgi:diaminopimelate decarboxylase
MSRRAYSKRINFLALARKHGTPLYVYDAEIIRNLYHALQNGLRCPELEIYYSCKANTNPHILKLIKQLGGGIEAVSEGEVSLALRTGFRPKQILYTCNGASLAELKFLAKNDILVHLDSLSQLQKWGEIKPRSSVSLRVNLNIGAGHHNHTITGGARSKFGIDHSQIKDAKRLAKKYNLTIVSIHQHIGSGILKAQTLTIAAEALFDAARQLPDLKLVDLGGGFGVPYQPGQRALDVGGFGRKVRELGDAFSRHYGRRVKIAIEPGRYLVAEAGTLLASVTDIKKSSARTFVSIDTGFNHLIRPAMYGSYHEIINVSRPRGKSQKVTVVGNICESGDTFAKDRNIISPREGDILAILDVGAYGYTMSSLYNSRVRPAEVMIDRGRISLIRKRQTLQEALPYS